MSLSKISKTCSACKYKEDCNIKRMEACAALYNEPLASPYNQPLTKTIMEDMAIKHDFRDVKMAENTTVIIGMEELKKKIRDKIYRNLGCDFFKEAT